MIVADVAARRIVRSGDLESSMKMPWNVPSGDFESAKKVTPVIGFENRFGFRRP